MVMMGPWMALKLALFCNMGVSGNSFRGDFPRHVHIQTRAHVLAQLRRGCLATQQKQANPAPCSKAQSALHARYGRAARHSRKRHEPGLRTPAHAASKSADRAR